MNPVAGVRKAPASILAKVMTAEGAASDVVYTGGKGQGVEMAAAGVDDGYDLVVAVGGDGTVNEVAQGVIGSGVPMGVVPCGSGNALARFLGLPDDPAAACRLMMLGSTRTLDVGRIGDHVFISSAGIGIDAEVCRTFNSRPGSRRGLLPYVVAGFLKSLTYKPSTVQMVMDGTTRRGRPVLLAFSNTGRFGNGVTIAPAARADDGLLDICFIEDIGFWKLLWHSRRLFTGTVDRMPGYTGYQTASCRIECEVAPLFQVDGEDVQSTVTTLDVSVEPAALTLAAPEAS